MPEEVYQFIFRSGDGSGSDNSSRTYSVNWGDVLPKDVKQFVVRPYFRSIYSATNTETDVWVYVDGGLHARFWDSKRSSTSKALCYATSFPNSAGNKWRYANLDNDVEGLLVDAPWQNSLTLTVYKLDTTTAFACADWILYLEFKPIRNKL